MFRNLLPRATLPLKDEKILHFMEPLLRKELPLGGFKQGEAALSYFSSLVTPTILNF